MKRRPKITVVGSYNQDLTVRTPRIPAAGETILGGPFFTGPGGKGANQAVAAARLGADVTMVARLGRDHYGDQALSNLNQEGVNTDSVFRMDDTHTGVALIVVDDSGENMIVVASGANLHLTPDDLVSAEAAITSADVLLLQLEVPLPTVEAAARMAHEAGVRVILNPAPGQPLSPDLLCLVDYLTPNETEAQLITSRTLTAVEEAQAAARQLLDEGVAAVIVTLGAQGALLATPEGARQISGYPVDVVDTTGAGDAFNGALAVAVAEGRPLHEAVAFANRAAALKVTKLGTAPAMPYRAEVDKAQ